VVLLGCDETREDLARESVPNGVQATDGMSTDAPASPANAAESDAGSSAQARETEAGEGVTEAGGSDDVTATEGQPDARRTAVPLDHDSLGFSAAELLAVAAGTHEAQLPGALGALTVVVPDTPEGVFLLQTPSGRGLEVEVDARVSLGGLEASGGRVIATQPEVSPRGSERGGTDYFSFRVAIDPGHLPRSYLDGIGGASECEAAAIVVVFDGGQAQSIVLQITTTAPRLGSPAPEACHYEVAESVTTTSP
jgi:hypothetical protein